MSKLLADIYALYLTDQDLGILRNLNACQLCNGMSALAYDLCIQCAVDDDGLSYLLDFILF